MGLARWRTRWEGIRRAADAYGDPLQLDAIRRAAEAHCDPELPARLEQLERRRNLHALIPPTMAWIDTADVPATRISVVIATKNRVDWLQRAVSSVLTQHHAAFELVIVDDGSNDGTAEWLSTQRDPRVLTLRTAGVGLTAARNLGIGAATSDFITYLDDDNAMIQGWLRAVAWAFSRFPDAEIIYGARVMEDRANIDGSTPASTEGALLPSVEFEPFSRDALAGYNIMDANSIAHRREHPEAHFDDRLGYASDWDLALRFTKNRDAVAIPVLACAYTTREGSRMSLDRPAAVEDLQRVVSMHGIDTTGLAPDAKL